MSEAFLSLTVLLTPDGVDCIRGNIGGYPRLLLAIFAQRRLGTPTPHSQMWLGSSCPARQDYLGGEEGTIWGLSLHRLRLGSMV